MQHGTPYPAHPQQPPGAMPHPQGGYRPLEPLGTVMLVLGPVLFGIVIVSDLLTYFVPPSSILLMFTGFGLSLLQVGTFIVAGFWFYRAAENARVLAPYPPKWNPGWAFGVWLIPVANYVLPYLFTREIWRRSSPDHAQPEEVPVPQWFNVWWFTFAAYWFVLHTSMFFTAATGFMEAFRSARTGQAAPTVGDLMPAPFLLTLAAVKVALLVVSWLCFRRLVREIDARQQRKSALLAATHGAQATGSAQAAAPPHGTF